MTVQQLEETMTNDEFVRWSVYYGRKAQAEELAMAKAKRR